MVPCSISFSSIVAMSMESALLAVFTILPSAVESFMSNDRNRGAPECARDSKVTPGPNPSEMN
eukprot:11797237-Heterocapsa_arctica.AAC.1